MLMAARTAFIRQQAPVVATPSITFVIAMGASATNGTPITLGFSSDVLQNDIALFIGMGTTTAAAGNPAGWTSIYTGTADTFGAQVSRKVLGASPITDSEVTLNDPGGTNEAACGCMLAFRGVSTITPEDVTFQKSLNATPAPITPSNNNCAIVVLGAATNGDTSVGSMTGYTVADNRAATDTERGRQHRCRIPNSDGRRWCFRVSASV